MDVVRCNEKLPNHRAEPVSGHRCHHRKVGGLADLIEVVEVVAPAVAVVSEDIWCFEGKKPADFRSSEPKVLGE